MVYVESCVLCTRGVCCCASIHRRNSTLKKKPIAIANIITSTTESDDCCTSGSCKKNNDSNVLQPNLTKTTRLTPSFSSSSSSSSNLYQFLIHVKGLYAAALGIEILCIAAAEIGENTGLYLLGFHMTGIPIAYVMGYSLAGFATFAAILGRYNYASKYSKVDSCCSVLEQGAGSGFIPNLKITFKNFVIGITRLPWL